MSDQCPVVHGANAPTTTVANHMWWPEQLNLGILHQGHPASNPMDDDFDYAAELHHSISAQLRLISKPDDRLSRVVASRLRPLRRPHDRMAWHAAGTYRIEDGRGGAGTGNHRFAPLNSWPDNGNLDKARMLLLQSTEVRPQISWADLAVLAGNVALRSMGFKTFGFAGGREDIYAPEDDIYWGPESGGSLMSVTPVTEQTHWAPCRWVSFM